MSLCVTIHSCTSPREAKYLDKTDPYVEVQCGGCRKRTRTKWDAGETARFEETFTLPIPADKSLKLTLFDAEDLGPDLALASKVLPADQVVDRARVELGPTTSVTYSLSFASQ
eukprot:Gregarina_sp_Pseudo_9__1785@NODE_2213_length_1094_cov_69_105213_g2038_i0_p2_GENE_NODE_2213_length_1094_cov_69_105213_g2038_i0NODE_2213_length_1094_cov_69_105213_g2038_i0_p2_ORF_typecomplete_len113_score14_85C2/PF00168_30/1_3e11_NODE_2213_length_1094_cov_69_105213_g2038_i0390728